MSLFGRLTNSKKNKKKSKKSTTQSNSRHPSDNGERNQYSIEFDREPEEKSSIRSGRSTSTTETSGRFQETQPSGENFRRQSSLSYQNNTGQGEEYQGYPETNRSQYDLDDELIEQPKKRAFIKKYYKKKMKHRYKKKFENLKRSVNKKPKNVEQSNPYGVSYLKEEYF